MYEARVFLTRCLAMATVSLAFHAVAIGGQFMPLDATRQFVFVNAQNPPTVADRAEALRDLANRTGKVRVIVRLKSSATPEATLSSAKVARQRANLQALQDRVLGALAPQGSVDSARVRRFVVTPALAMEATADEITQFQGNPEVEEVVEDHLNYPGLYASSPLIGATDAWASGYAGSGQVVAILDSGVYKSHPFLTGKVVSEACYSTTYAVSGVTYTSLCPGGVASSTAVNSGLNCNTTTWGEGCSHGTHVAGIAAGANGASSHGIMSGVAKAASLIAIQVFSGVTDSGGTDIAAFDSDLISGLERVYALRSTYNIAAANLSLGGGQYAATCDSSALKPIIDNLRAVGIATVIASGNDGWSGATNAPGCISTAITVGSSTKVDQEASYSNMASWVDLFGPGSDICSSVVAVTANCGSGYAAWNGTSMATPQVAGAWAVMKSRKPTASVAEVEAALKNTGVPVSTYLGSWPRISLVPALAQLADPTYLLTVSKSGTGTGTVTSSPAGISCGATCSASFTSNSTVLLTAVPATGSTFTGWVGCSSTSGTTCTVSMTAVESIDATFMAAIPNPTESDANGNTAGGTGTLGDLTVGSANTGFGFSSLASNTTGWGNSASGYEALSANVTGTNNTAMGNYALRANTGGSQNTAMGYNVLPANTTGLNNTGIGTNTLKLNTTGNGNAAIGINALYNNTTGGQNLAFGRWALIMNTTGSSNVGLGNSAGSNLTTGSNNIDIGSPGEAGENGTIRMGDAAVHSRTFIAGIRGTQNLAGSLPVYIDPNGQLGISVSSEQYKEDIIDMGDASQSILKLRPVTYHYKAPDTAGGKSLEYGLIAEEVSRVYPDLVAYDAKGQIQSVQYQKLTPMLLNELQRLNLQLAAERKKTGELVKKMADFEARAQRLEALEIRLLARERVRKSGPQRVSR